MYSKKKIVKYKEQKKKMGKEHKCWKETNLIVNGNFVQGVFSGAPYDTFYGGSDSLFKWVIGGDSIDVNGSYWINPLDNTSKSVDLSGNAPGSISQTFSTKVGKKYRIYFYMAGNFECIGFTGFIKCMLLTATSNSMKKQKT